MKQFYTFLILVCITHQDHGVKVKLENQNENMTHTIYQNTLIACDEKSDYADQRFVECQVIQNMFVPHNDKLDCYGSSLYIEFDIFATNSCDEQDKNSSLGMYTKFPTGGYLMQLTSNVELEREANVIMFNPIQKGQKKVCKIIKR